MKGWIYWLFIIALITAPVQSYAWMSTVLVGGGVPEVESCSGGAFACSDFEDADDRNQWSYSSADLDHSSSGLSMTGDYVARLDSTEDITFYFSSSSSIYIVAQLRYEDSLENSEFQTKIESSSLNVCYSQWTSGGSLNAYSTAYGSAVGSAHAVDTTRWYKFYWEAGSGSDGVCGACFWNGSSWSCAEQTDSTRTEDAVAFVLQNFQDGTGVEYWYSDEFHFFTSDFTDDPTTL